MPQMSQNDSHFEVFSFEMTQNDSFPSHKCPTEHTLSVADETLASPPSPQNDSPGSDPSADGHPANPKPQSAHQVWHDRPPNDAPPQRRACLLSVRAPGSEIQENAMSHACPESTPYRRLPLIAGCHRQHSTVAYQRRSKRFSRPERMARPFEMVRCLRGDEGFTSPSPSDRIQRQSANGRD